MNPKGLASNRKMKKGGRAAVIPLGEVIRRPQPEAEEQGVLDRQPKSPNLKAIICIRYLPISKSEFLAPPIIPPGGQRVPPGRLKSSGTCALNSIKISIMF